MAPVSRTETPPGGDPVVPVENLLVAELTEREWTVAVAESLTGGEVTARLCASPGTGERVLGGIVSYSTATKRHVLDVEADLVVSEDAARQMATGVRKLFDADVGLSLTGVAGPKTQDDQPVGTVCVGWTTPLGDGAARLSCAGAPEQIRREAADAAMRRLLTELGGS